MIFPLRIILFNISLDSFSFIGKEYIFFDEIKHLNCVALDNNIRYLHPYRYSYKPGFYQDDANKIATALITVDSLPVIGTIPVIGEWIGFTYLAYSSLVEEKEQRRMRQVEQQIAMLQQVKSEKHCFE